MPSDYTIYKEKINNFLKYCERNYAFYGNPEWLEDEGTINVIIIRNNEEIDFNNRLMNNDELIIFENRPNNNFRRYDFKVTADPRSKKNGIAHLIEGAYESYSVGLHRNIIGRVCLRQTEGQVRIARTDTLGRLIGFYWGYFGINVHDSGGFLNSSLGCIVIAYDKQSQYQTEFKPLLLSAKQFHKKLNLKFSLFIINYKTFKNL